MENTNLIDRLNRWARQSVTLKLFSIGFLILLLMIPGKMLNSLIFERENTRDAAIAEVSESWGAPQTIGGPVISLPFSQAEKNERGITEIRTRYAHFLPENIEITGHLVPVKKYRGIYIVVLYESELNIKGRFRKIDPETAGVPAGSYDLSKAYISLGITDNKGISDNLYLDADNLKGRFMPGLPSNDIFASGVSQPVRLNDTIVTFNIRLKLRGSSELYFLPFGEENNISLSGNWNHPSFQGYFLPETKSITDTSFTADWRILQLNRNYPQQGIGNFISVYPDDNLFSPETRPQSVSAFGLKLLLPVDEYQKTMRTSKYGMMFVIITFLAFFFIEVLNSRRVHPIQYFLIGCAVILFYVLLLSISEHLTFNTAYLISSVSVMVLISLYAKAVLKNTLHALIIAAILSVLYIFFYSLLQLQDYALLLGSIGLFGVLALIMYLTRKINWYNPAGRD